MAMKIGATVKSTSSIIPPRKECPIRRTRPPVAQAAGAAGVRAKFDTVFRSILEAPFARLARGRAGQTPRLPSGPERGKPTRRPKWRRDLSRFARSAALALALG